MLAADAFGALTVAPRPRRTGAESAYLTTSRRVTGLCSLMPTDDMLALVATVLIPIPDTDFDPTEVAVSWQVLTGFRHTVVFRCRESAKIDESALNVRQQL